ncbi:energy transducer TonB [Candidatus Palauibacter sp.]|uniref:energy transducer TonB n=1 Tax=Candidatus Palauibacter sp. TaxID=3101350 RepID=UPI003AF30BF9
MLAYPPDLLARGVGGRVEVWVHVDTTGNAGSGEVKTSSGNDDLDCAAMQVGDVMEFEPALNEGRSARVWTSQWVEFQPESAAGKAADPDRPPCEPFDTNPVSLSTDTVVRWLEASYPPRLREQGIGGSVVLWLRVGESGEVLETEVRQSSGHPALDDAAGAVAMNMRFEPAKRLGRPTAVWVHQRLTFSSIPRSR